MTSLQTCEGGLYLAAEMDLCSRRILGWSTRKDRSTDPPNCPMPPWRSLSKLAAQPKSTCAPPSDGGRQNNSGEFRKPLELRGITASRSRKASCYDNAAMESFCPPSRPSALAQTSQTLAPNFVPWSSTKLKPALALFY